MKPTLKIGVAAVAVSLVFAAGYAQGQNATEKERLLKRFEDKYLTADTDLDLDSKPEIRDQVLSYQRQALSNPEQLNIIERNLLRLPDEQANKRLQILQIEQNAQIIQLLKQIAADKNSVKSKTK